jgi:hypothetical protein
MPGPIFFKKRVFLYKKLNGGGQISQGISTMEITGLVFLKIISKAAMFFVDR